MNKFYRINAVVYLVSLLLTTGNSAYSFLPDALTTETNAAPLVPKEVTHQNLLYLLLTAEMAAQRQEPMLAWKLYLKAAEITKDPAIAEQATLLAISLEAGQEAVKSALLWAENDPQNIQAQLIAMTLLINQSIENALPYIIQAIELQPLEADQYLLEIQERLSAKNALRLKRALHRLAIERSSDPNVQLAAAQSAAEQKDVKNAERWVDSALKLQPNLTRAILLKSRLIRYQNNSEAPALQFLAKQLQQFPDNAELRFFYAGALLDVEKYSQAKNELMHLIKDKTFGGAALLLLGEVYLQDKQWKKATQFLLQAANIPSSQDGAYYLLGEIAEQQGHLEQAVAHYSAVAPGSYHLPAILQAIALLKETGAYQEAITLLHNSVPANGTEQKQLLLVEIDLLNASKASEEAWQLTNDILAKIPDDLDLIYQRAITATHLKKWDSAEHDLQKILKKNPANAEALNALGYVLSLNPQRLPEAIDYLTEALSITPNNPHFMDALGWAYYQLGNLQQALFYLQKANELTIDGKIAAHFGEVLWASNQKTQAVQVWKKALEQNAKQEELLETLKRYSLVSD